MKQRLSDASLALLARDIRRPTYDRKALKTGIVHLGVGAFHRAHQALYTEAVIARGDLNWGTIGASLRSPDTHDALKPQDGLYTVAIRDANGDALQIVGNLLDLLVAPDDPAALLDAMTGRDVKIVTLTITEKGYCHDPATGKLKRDNPDIVHDLSEPAAPKSALGYIVEAARRRRAKNLTPFAVLSCDNLPENGRTLKRLLVEFASLFDVADKEDLAEYIEREVACPCTMVDRIVPATTDADRAIIAETTGLKDAWPVMTEPFTQWVIEDRFPQGRPDWSVGGAQFVDDARPFETMKLRLLNGAHSSIAYLGYLAGFETVSDAMREPALADHVASLMREEIAPTLKMPDGAELDAYIIALLARFRNPALRHRTWQIAMDGSQKLPQRLLNTIRDRIASSLPFDRLALGVAAWMRYVSGIDERGNSIDVRDPLAAQFRSTAERHSGDHAGYVRELLAIPQIFGADLSGNNTFSTTIARAFMRLNAQGAVSAIKAQSP